ncbi:hypothetical protein C6P44_001764 [Monosporozyma unispora]|nr:hypothetical protein C6P44_001764 [Kazachstania unispora]
MDSQGMLLPDIKEEELTNTLLLPEKMDFIETVKSNESSTIDENNKTVTQLNSRQPEIPMNNSADLETSENNIITPDNTTILLSSSLKMPVSNEDLSLLPPLPNTDELNVPTEQPIQPSPLQTEIISNTPSVIPLTTTPENEELNLINALDMNTNETTHLSRSSSLKSVLRSTLSHQDTQQQQQQQQVLDEPHSVSTAVVPQHIHIPLPRSLSRSNSNRRDRNTSFSSSSSASPSPSSHLPNSNNTSTSSNPTTNNTSPKFPLLRRASSKLLRKASFKSLSNNNSSNNQSTTSIASHHKVRTSPLLLQTGFDNSTPVISNSSSSSSFHGGNGSNSNNITPVTTIPKSRPSLRLRLSSHTLSSSTSNTPQPQQPPLQRTSSILSRKSSLGSKMKLNLSRIISGSSKHPPPLSHQNSNDHIPPVISSTYTSHNQDKIINHHTIVTPRQSTSTNPSPSTLSSFPISHNGKDSNPLTKMVSIDLQKINKPRPTIVTLDDTLSDIVTISKESNVSIDIISQDAKDQISMKDYYSLLQEMSEKEDAKLKFIEDRFSQSGWCSKNELNQLKQKRIIINKLWKEKLHGHDIQL